MKFVTVDVPLPNDGSFTIDGGLAVSGTGFTVVILHIATQQTEEVHMEWDATRSAFVRR